MPESALLAGVRVLELATMLVGPSAAQTLADLGADVIKVEPPKGDLTRQIGPRASESLGSFFMSLNRNKRSVQLDLFDEDDRAVFHRLIEECDVFVHTVRSKAATRLGINFDELHKLNESLIHCQVVGYGDGGRYAGRPAYDTVIQAAAGLSSLESSVVGKPAYSPSIHADKICGLYAANAILASLYRRAQRGGGQQIVIPMFETVTAYTMLEHQWGAVFEPPRGPMGYGPILAQTRLPFPTLDGHISVLPYTDKHWKAFFTDVVEAPEVYDDERFHTFAARITNQTYVWDVVAEALTHFTNQQLAQRLADSDIPFSVVNSLPDLLEDPHLADVEFWDIRDDENSTDHIRSPKFPVEFDGARPEMRHLAPRLDADGDEIRGGQAWLPREA